MPTRLNAIVMAAKQQPGEYEDACRVADRRTVAQTQGPPFTTSGAYPKRG